MRGEERVHHYERVELMAQVGSWIWNPGDESLWWSPGMHAIFGVSIEDFDGRMESLFLAAVPEDRDLLTEAAARYQQTGVPELLKYRIRRPDGEIRHVWAFGESVEGPSGARIARGYVLDVTDRTVVEEGLRAELTAAEVRLLDIVDGAPLPAMLVADDGVVLRVNDRFTQLTGYRHGDVPTLEAWIERSQAGEDVAAALTRLFEGGAPTDGDERSIATVDGRTLRWLDSTARVGRLGDGREVAISMARDVTDLRASELEDRRLEKQRQQTRRIDSLRVLAAGVAHDLGNLLTGVIGNVALALERADDETLRGLLAEIGAAADQAASLSRDMLTFTGERFDAGPAIALDAELVALHELLAASAGRSHVELEPRAGDVEIPISGAQLAEIALNLVSNAGEACSGEPIVVRTGIETLAGSELSRRYPPNSGSPGRFAFVEVEDRGEGMDDATAGRLFEPFFSTKSVGRGLGMAVVLGIARSVGGVALVDSEPGRGSRVRVSVPVARRAPEAAVVASEADADAEVARPAILVVDDEPVARDALCRKVERLGYRAIGTSDGATALDIFAAREEMGAAISAAIVDLTMPTMSGDELLRQLKKQRPSLPVILATRFSRAQLAGAMLGQDALLGKPVALAELEAILDTLVTQPDTTQ